MVRAMATPFSPISFSPLSRSSRTSPRSPGRRRATLSVVALQLTQFLDEWYAHALATSLGKTMSRFQACRAALELLVMNGVQLSDEEIDWCCAQSDATLVKTVVQRIPQILRDVFEALTEQLMIFLVTACRVRNAAESNSDDLIAEVLEEEDFGAMKDRILREVVVKAGSDIEQQYRCQETWIKASEHRLNRLAHSKDTALVAQQRLVELEGILEGMESNSKRKSKKALLMFKQVMCGNSLFGFFHWWKGVSLNTRGERLLREKYEAELSAGEQKLGIRRNQVIETMKVACARSAEQGLAVLFAQAFHGWADEVAAAKLRVAEDETFSKLQCKLSLLSAEASAKAKAVVSRFMDGADQALHLRIFQTWRQEAVTQKGERKLAAETEEKARALKEALKARKEEVQIKCQAVFAELPTIAKTRLWQGWLALVQENRDGRRMSNKVVECDVKLRRVSSSHKSCKMAMQERVVEQNEVNFLLRCVMAWEMEAKVNRIDRRYKAKIDGKRKQLGGVRDLFRTFAEKLEEGLSSVEDCASSGFLSGRGLSRKNAHSSSLPSLRASSAISVC